MHPLERLSRALVDAEENGQDPQTSSFLEDILTPDFSIARFKGNVDTKKDYIDKVRQSQARGRRADDYLPVREYNHCCGIVVFRVTVPDGDSTTDYRNTQVFVRHETGWRCAAWQTTRMEARSSN